MTQGQKISPEPEKNEPEVEIEPEVEPEPEAELEPEVEQEVIKVESVQDDKAEIIEKNEREMTDEDILLQDSNEDIKIIQNQIDESALLQDSIEIEPEIIPKTKTLEQDQNQEEEEEVVILPETTENVKKIEEKIENKEKEEDEDQIQQVAQEIVDTAMKQIDNIVDITNNDETTCDTVSIHIIER